MAEQLIGNVKGPQGDAATITVGTTTTGAAGTNASVTNSGTSSAAVLNFTIPKGAKGDQGDPGVTSIASSSALGLVKIPSGGDMAINSGTGALSLNTATITEAGTLANLANGDSLATILGKIKKFITTLMPSTFLKDNVISTDTDKALSAKQGKMLAEIIANVQDSHTASKAYSVGDYIVMDSKLYIVTSPIANGGTITSGTNVGLTSLGSRLKITNDTFSNRLNGIAIKRLRKADSSTTDVFTSNSASGRHMLLACDSVTSRCAAWFVYSSGQNVVGYAEILGGSNYTLSISDNTFTVTHTSGRPYYMDFAFDDGLNFLTIS